MDDFLNNLYSYLYENKCPSNVDLKNFTREQGCPMGEDQDLQICRNCWQSAIIKLDKED